MPRREVLPPSLGGFVLNEAEGTLSEEEERERGEQRKSRSFPIFDTNKDASSAAVWGKKAPKIGDADKVWRGLALGRALLPSWAWVACLV